MLVFVQMSFSQKGFVELVKIVVEFSDINSQVERDLGKSLAGGGGGKDARENQLGIFSKNEGEGRER